MKILHTPVRFHPAIGGVETVVLGLCRALVELGHDVSVVCSDEAADGAPALLDGVRVHRLRTLAKLANTNLTPGLPAALLRQSFDVVHTHLPTPWSADWSAWLGRARGKAVVLTYYNDIVGVGLANAIAKTYDATLLRVLLRASHQVITLTPEHVQSPSSRLKPVWHKSHLLSVGVNVREFCPRPELRQPRRIGFLAVLDEFHRYKGLDVLLRAVKILAERGERVQLCVGGKGTLRGEYERLADDLGVAAQVEFIGRIPDDELSGFFNRCAAFVLPSISGAQEGYGLVALEAMACGAPIVTTDAAGIAPIVGEAKAGLVVAARDEDALADAIARALNDPNSAQLGANGRALVESQFSWRAIAQDYERVYRLALGGEPHGR